MKSLLSANSDVISRHSHTKWNIPKELADSIALIEQYDSTSTFSRYPTSNSKFDTHKSHFEPLDIAELANDCPFPDKDHLPPFLIVVTDESNNAFHAYKSKNSVLPDLRNSLLNASKHLSGIAFGLKAELVDGVCPPQVQPHETGDGQSETTEDPVVEEGVSGSLERYNSFFSYIEPHLSELVLRAQELCGNDALLVCLNIEMLAGVHPCALEIFEKYGKDRCVQYSDLHCCIPVSHREMEICLEKHDDLPLGQSDDPDSNGPTILYFEEEMTFVQRVVARAQPDPEGI